MKFILVLCLLALISCDVLDVLKCLASQPKVQELALQLVSLLVNQEYDKILPTVLGHLGDLVAAVRTCVA